MCGIAGIISWDDRRPVTEAQLRAMAARIAHRGPDAEATWLGAPADDVRTGFAFRRLSILDCDARAMQPMSTPDARFTLVFNGEIYNFRDLKKQLPPRNWQTTGDTEVLLAALAAWGPDAAIERLEGMFAIALWDARERTLLLARDRAGQKPLYVATADGGAAFASELGALHEWPHWDRATDDTALAYYLRYGYVLPPRTIFRGVRQLEPGTRWLLRAGPPAPPDVRRWFTISRLDAEKTLPPAATDVRGLVERAVRGQLVSDVPLGVFLSGGIDSSVVALAARRAGPVKTFSIGFDDARYDETPFAEAVAKHLGTEHHTFRVTHDIAADLPKLAAVFGEPFGDSSALPTHWLSQQTRKQVTVALSGDGGDELFGGYDRYRALGLNTAWLSPLAPLGRRLAGGHPKSRRTRVGRFLASAGLSTAARYDGYVSLFSPEDTAALLGRPVDNDDREALFDALLARRGPVETATAFDRVTYLPGDLLTKVDRCSMLHGLEVRSPFMDTDLLRLADTLRRRDLIAGGPKRLLREAFAADLPALVFTRPKRGFAVPVGDWFRGPLRAMLRDHLSAGDGFCRTHFDHRSVDCIIDDHENGRRDHGQRLYALLMLELWHRPPHVRTVGIQPTAGL